MLKRVFFLRAHGFFGQLIGRLIAGVTAMARHPLEAEGYSPC
jgi:hypothetical protein